MKMSRKEIISMMDSVFSRGLFAAMIVFRSPITGKLDERHVYADSNFEVVEWADKNSKFYLENDIPFISYVNNSIRETFKFEITEEDCYDE